MTYSIIARDPVTGELGISVQSRSFAAGQIVPWIEAGVGVIASQSFANPVYGYESLRLLKSGLEPQHILNQLTSKDPGAGLRQVAILDSHGRMAVHTGASCVSAAGHAVGINCCAQANMMMKDTVWKAMVRAFENSSGQFADRLLSAMDAAEQEGGDLRGRQAASLIVVTGKPSDISRLDYLVNLRVDDHPNPVGEIKRLLNYTRTHQRADQAIDKAMSGDFVNALADLDACCAAYPDEPEFLFRRALVLLPLGRMEEAREALQRAHDIHPGWSQLPLRFADAGIVPLSREVLEPLIVSLSSGRPT